MLNIASFAFTAEELAQFDGAIGTVDSLLARAAVLAPVRKTTMGDKSEAFCRQALDILAANPQIVPPSLDVAAAQADLAALDALRPRLLKLQRLLERGQDAETALGMDLMAASLDAYALLKAVGKDENLKAARKDLAARWAKGPRGQGDDPQGS